MKNSINLLPYEISPHDTSYKALKIIQKITYALIVLFLITGAVTGAFLLSYSNKVKGSTKIIEKLNRDILNYGPQEQKIVFIKDRLEKIKPILEDKKLFREIEKLRQINLLLPSGVSYFQVEIDGVDINLVFVADTSSSLTSFMKVLKEKNFYESLTLKNLELRPVMGYILTLKAK